jgi:hypothetical protein
MSQECLLFWGRDGLCSICSTLIVSFPNKILTFIQMNAIKTKGERGKRRRDRRRKKRKEEEEG